MALHQAINAISEAEGTNMAAWCRAQIEKGLAEAMSDDRRAAELARRVFGAVDP